MRVKRIQNNISRNFVYTACIHKFQFSIAAQFVMAQLVMPT